MDLTRAIGRGYLPKEFPPLFSSQSLADARGQLTEKRPESETLPVRFSLARAGGLRRATEVPNPFSQISLIEHVGANWSRFRAVAALSVVSTSRPLLGARNDQRSLKHVGSPEKYERVRRSIGARYTLSTDISNFFPSIYTHAVDWAVRGKAAAKRDRSSKSVGGRLDLLLRRARGGQTVGISVGPDTSWLISEMILARVDQKLQIRAPRVKNRSLRWVDDMVFYADSQGVAEEALGIYEEELSQYELSLNPLKTSITTGIKPYVDNWLVTLRQARYRDDRESHQADDIVDLFSLAFELHEKLPNSGVISYAIKRCNPFPAAKGWEVYQELVLASMALESSSMKHAFDVLTFAHEKGFVLDTKLIEETCNTLILRHAPLQHDYEVAWLLSLMREVQIEPSDSAVDAALAMGCNASCLLAWEAIRKSPFLSLTTNNLNLAVRRAEAADALWGEDWLLAYEARARGWCSPKSWGRSSAWRELQKLHVRFLDVPDAMTAPLRRSRIKRLRPAFVSTWGS